MRKILLGLFLATASMGINAQTNLTQAVDFTVTFTDGEEFNLFDKLAEGKYVCVDWFFTTCGPCQANQPYYTETFQNFGCNDPSADMFFLSVETTVGDALTIAYEENFAGENAPPAASGTEGGGADAAGPYSIGAYPTFILIAPDGTILEQDMWPLTNGAATFTSYFEGHGISQMVCSTDIADDQSVKVNAYPNPAQDNVTVELAGFNGPVNIDIFNVVGELVYSAQTTAVIETIDVSAWDNGNYMMNIYNESESLKKQISVIR